ncbi:MAG TPA: hypothetical protein VLG44_00755 [Chlamydiales bacterium]|nr:hypothetical protein [Chlamydiales bacterium]
MKHLQIVHKLFEWTAKNLVHDSHLKKTDISHFFADHFLVIANGKRYDANHDNYFEFLQSFRLSIRKISHDLGEMIADERSVALPMKARIVRTNETVENYEAILILKFNAQNKIILWHEVYLKI